jgi:type I restriction enzyme S subunit
MDHVYENTRELEAICKKKLTALAELKQSILQKAFAGELTADMNQDAVAI